MEELSDYPVVQSADLDDPAATNGATNGVIHAKNGRQVAADPVPLDVSVMAAAGRGRADTWGSNLPALRLGAEPASETSASDELPDADPEPVRPFVELPVPRPLRATRGLAGVLLLLLAWAATVGCIMLGQLLVNGFPQEQSLFPRIGLYVVTAIAAGWVGMVALACLVAAAFALSLAVRSRGW